MNAFQLVSLALPMAAAFAFPALIAWKPGWRVPTIAGGGIALLALLLGIVSGAGWGAAFSALLLTTAFVLLAVGAHFAAGPVASGLLVVVLHATLFAGGPWVDEAIVRNDAPAISRRVETLVAVNPYAVMASSVFGIDVLRIPMHYGSSFADYRTTYPNWPPTALGYVLAGGALGAVGWARRKRKPA